MKFLDFKRLIRPIQNKIFLLIGRAVLTAVNNTPLTQNIQVLGLSDEVISDIERFQEYGFETYPPTDAEVFIGFLNGNRDHGIALCVHDRRYRPLDLTEGEICLYTDEDKTTPFRIQMKRDRTHYRRSDKEDIDIDTSKTEDIGTSKTVNVPTSSYTNTSSHTRTTPSETHTNTTEHIINSPEVSLGGSSFAGLRKIIDERFIALFNAHVHSGVTTGSGNTGSPTSAMSTGSHATSKVKAI